MYLQILIEMHSNSAIKGNTGHWRHLQTQNKTKSKNYNKLAKMSPLTLVILSNLHRYIQQRSQTLCNGFVSHGAQFECLWVLPTTYAKTNAKQIMFMIFVCLAALYACLSSLSDSNTCTLNTYALDEPLFRNILIAGKNQDPQMEPHAGIKMVQVLGSLVYICGTLTSVIKPCLLHIRWMICYSVASEWSVTLWPHAWTL